MRVRSNMESGVSGVRSIGGGIIALKILESGVGSRQVEKIKNLVNRGVGIVQVSGSSRWRNHPGVGRIVVGSRREEVGDSKSRMYKTKTL